MVQNRVQQQAVRMERQNKKGKAGKQTGRKKVESLRLDCTTDNLAGNRRLQIHTEELMRGLGTGMQLGVEVRWLKTTAGQPGNRRLSNESRIKKLKLHQLLKWLNFMPKSVHSSWITAISHINFNFSELLQANLPVKILDSSDVWGNGGPKTSKMEEILIAY